MESTTILQLLSGMLVMGYGISALFFFKFWSVSKEALFRIFAFAFLTLAFQRLVMAVTTETVEDVTYLYVIRLFAYLLIVVAILLKNRRDQ